MSITALVRYIAKLGWVGAIAAFALLISISLIQAQEHPIAAKVDYAKSGHTLELLSELSPTTPVLDIRLAGIQAPSRDQNPWGSEARECLADLVNDRRVRIEPQSEPAIPDKYNRLWAYVWHESELMNAAALAHGCAYLQSDRLATERYATQLIHAQAKARILGLGLWDPENPLR